MWCGDVEKVKMSPISGVGWALIFVALSFYVGLGDQNRKVFTVQNPNTLFTEPHQISVGA